VTQIRARTCCDELHASRRWGCYVLRLHMLGDRIHTSRPIVMRPIIVDGRMLLLGRLRQQSRGREERECGNEVTTIHDCIAQ